MPGFIYMMNFIHGDMTQAELDFLWLMAFINHCW